MADINTNLNDLQNNANRLAVATSAIANAIVAKGGTVTSGDGLEEFPADIGTIVDVGPVNDVLDISNDELEAALGGGGSIPVAKGQVNFYDYDGTIVKSMSSVQFRGLESMPTNPSHEGLTAQGWNWSLSDAKTYVASYGSLDIGQTYTTSDGRTYLHIRLGEGRLKPYLGLTGNSSGTTVSIDWGDSSAVESVTLNNSTVYTAHEYVSDGEYVISITVTNGTISLNGTSSSTNLFRKAAYVDANNDKVYASILTKVELGTGVTFLETYAFGNCSSLSSITIPSTVTSIGNGIFNNCSSLTSVTIPSTVTSIGDYIFSTCYSLTSVTIPSTVTSIGTDAFSKCCSLSSITIPSTVTYIKDSTFGGCSSLSSITIPSGVTHIGNSAFYSCNALTSITIPSTVTSIGIAIFQNCSSLISITILSTVTSIGDTVFSGCSSLTSITIPSAVTSIGQSAFSSCSSLSSITIPSTVTSIKNNAFSGARGLGFIKFTSTTPPTVSASNAWAYLSADCIIYVPTGRLSDYTSAQYYPDPNRYTYVEY